MSIAWILGLLLYAGIAAAVAWICYRTWRLGKLPAFVAAACTTAAALVFYYATTGKTDAFNLLGVSYLLGIAYISAHAVLLVPLKLRGELDA